MSERTYTVERSATIQAPPARVYGHIVDFHNWTGWSPWEGLDPALERTYSGAESGTGAVYAWSGNRKAGKGRMEIVGAEEPSRVQIDLLFEKPWKSRSETLFTIQPEGSGSRVTWSMRGRKTFMTTLMGVFVSMDRLVGPDFERGLAGLKAAAEETADSTRIERRADLLPEERAAGSDDAAAQAAAILDESDERTEHPERTRRESTQTPDET